MRPATVLACAFPPSQGMKGARTTIADIAGFKRQGFLCAEQAREFARSVVLLHLSASFHGAGNRWRRRHRAMQPVRFAPVPFSDLANDQRNEGLVRHHTKRRPFRQNPHD